MGIKQGRPYLTLSDLEQYSIWKLNDVDDLMYPITCEKDSPDDIFDLCIRTRFFTPSGIEFLGYIVGFGDIFSIAIFIKENVFYFNRNLPGDYAKTLSKMSKILGKNLTLSNFSPLKYTTDFLLDGYNNFEGEFDLLKKRTDEERLKNT